jgi:uncharacterized protein with FMN-binding domain
MQMKSQKVILPAFVIVAFILYSVALRHDNTNSVVAPLSGLSSSSGSSSSQTAKSTQPSPTSTTPTTKYKDGNYTGTVADAFYGNIQVAVTINNNKITDVQFLQYPNDRPNSVSINSQAMPYLKQEAIQAQSAQVDGVSGATDTSQAFVQSLSAALSKAQA